MVKIVERAPGLRLHRAEKVVGERVALGLAHRLLGQVDLQGPGGGVRVAGAERRDQCVRGAGEPVVIVRREGAEGGAVDTEGRGELRRAIELSEGQRGRPGEVDLRLEAHDEADGDVEDTSQVGCLGW